ncbi:hypothetical protein HPP92_014245 [Vanilla planifolia]|uniref:DUF7054 domain-containing protein n=1 Tax=Vanilla planifolia TaxID=51239 RepID=A0A835QL18_VANPL|nr:hypothetical protein HPP92_014245 [Vanilla planifolia]
MTPFRSGLACEETIRRPGLFWMNSVCRPTKLLVNVTVERSLGPIHVLISPENTVAELIQAAVDTYVREGRRPLLALTDPKGFELHYSKFTLESLDPQEKVVNLGSRNFFVCSRISKAKAVGGDRSEQKEREDAAAVDVPPLQ